MYVWVFEFSKDRKNGAHMSDHCIFIAVRKNLYLHVDVKERTNRPAARPFLLLNPPPRCGGGPDWTRTSDPTLIKRVL
jgi:hypothetical protein